MIAPVAHRDCVATQSGVVSWRVGDLALAIWRFWWLALFRQMGRHKNGPPHTTGWLAWAASALGFADLFQACSRGRQTRDCTNICSLICNLTLYAYYLYTAILRMPAPFGFTFLKCSRMQIRQATCNMGNNIYQSSTATGAQPASFACRD